MNKGIVIGIAVAIAIGIAAVAAVSMDDEPSSPGGFLTSESSSEITTEETETEGKKVTITLTEKVGVTANP